MPRWLRYSLAASAVAVVVVVGLGVLVLWTTPFGPPTLNTNRDSHVHSVRDLLPDRPDGLRLVDSGIRDSCESDWFDRRPPVAWWEYDVVAGIGRQVSSAYEQTLLANGWSQVEAREGSTRLRRAQVGWTAEALLTSSDTRLSLSVYVLNSNNC